MKNIKELEERYFGFYCELGFDHTCTKAARKEYFDALRKESETINVIQSPAL